MESIPKNTCFLKVFGFHSKKNVYLHSNLVLMKLIERKQYTDKLYSLKDKKIIKVITGVRRCGKSTLMQLFQRQLLNSGVDKKNITTINFENYDFIDLRQPKELYRYVNERLLPNKMNYIFLDEIQHVDNYADVVDALFVKENTDIYITGSNAYLLCLM